MFTKRKFLILPLQHQHKKCAEMLKGIYEDHLGQKFFTKQEIHYQELLIWMGLPQQTFKDLKEIADAYHRHLNLAKRQLKEHNLLPSIRQLDRTFSEKTWPIAIYLDHIRSAHNVGSIIRTVEAFALGSLYFSADTPYITNKQVQDASMGTHAWVDCRLEEGIDKLPSPMIVMETSTTAIALSDFIFPEVFTLVIGNEEYGCSEKILKFAHYVVEIPLRGRKNSLNVANAFAIAAAEIQRQKGRR